MLDKDIKTKLREWINPVYLEDTTITKLQMQFKTNQPFPHLELKDFFWETQLIDILKELQKEPFALKHADLFKFRQTNDLSATQNELLKAYYDFIASKPFQIYLSLLTGLTFTNGIDMSGTFYSDTDYLLCHDDKLEGRKIAFMTYLSTLERYEGGAFCFYESKDNKPTKIAKRIVPEFNTFFFFQVTPTSFHSVEEVTANQARIALSGWFHG